MRVGLGSSVTGKITEYYRLRRGVAAVMLDDGRTRLVSPGNATTVGVLSNSDEALLRTLAREQCDAQELADSADLVAGLRAGGWLMVTVEFDGTPQYTVSPVRGPDGDRAPTTADLRLSRFALIRAAPTEEHALVLECPVAWCDVAIFEPSVLSVVSSGEHSFSPEQVAKIRDDLNWCGVLVAADGEEDFRHRQWSPHELWLHDRSMIGPRAYGGIANTGGYGGTNWASGLYPELPPAGESYPGKALSLPSAPGVSAESGSLVSVIESRRSVREYDDHHPLEIEQLGVFLERCGRSCIEVDENGATTTIRRPYPGTKYELEIYPLVRLVIGVDPGLYHYDSHEHALRLVRPSRHPAVRRLLSGVPNLSPQVLLLVTARVGRVLWRYEQMGYALIQKDVGVLYQTMYLVATDMRLGPCALGASDAHAFTQASGRDPLVECNVGAFALGSRHDGAHR